MRILSKYFLSISIFCLILLTAQYQISSVLADNTETRITKLETNVTKLIEDVKTTNEQIHTLSETIKNFRGSCVECKENSSGPTGGDNNFLGSLGLILAVISGFGGGVIAISLLRGKEIENIKDFKQAIMDFKKFSESIKDIKEASDNIKDIKKNLEHIEKFLKEKYDDYRKYHEDHDDEGSGSYVGAGAGNR